MSERWAGSTAVPGEPAYEASQRSLQALGVGERTPIVVVFHAGGDLTGSAPVEQAMDRVAAASPGAFTSSYFSTDDPVYLSQDRQAFHRAPGDLVALAARLRGCAWTVRVTVRRRSSPRGPAWSGHVSGAGRWCRAG